MNLKVDNNDGLFWMSIEDFKKHFQKFYISKYYDNYKFISLRVPYKKDGNYLFQVKIENAGRYTFGLSQKDRRNFGLTTDYDYSAVHFHLCKDDNNDLLDDFEHL